MHTLLHSGLRPLLCLARPTCLHRHLVSLTPDGEALGTEALPDVVLVAVLIDQSVDREVLSSSKQVQKG